jgi:5-bromo-4-chloroindolyl phosphate hydrolysis protein
MSVNDRRNNNYQSMSRLEMRIRSGMDDVTRSVNAGLHDAGINVNVDEFCREFLDFGFDIGRGMGRDFSGRNKGYRAGGYAPPPPPPPRREAESQTDWSTNSNSSANAGNAPKFTMPSAAERLTNKNKTKIANMKTASTFYVVCGWISAAIAALSALSLGSTLTYGGLISPAVFAVLSAVMFSLNASVRRRRRRYSRYLSLTEISDSADLTEIASISGESLKTVLKDIYNMIDAGYFGTEASVDAGLNMLYKTRAAASEAKEAENKRRSSEEAEKNTQCKSDISTDELDYNSIDDFDRIIERIRNLNDEIADVSVSERIYKIEAVTTHIFNYIKQHPDKFQSIRSFMSYYLPTTLKLLASYSAIEKAGVAGKNMSEAKESIESTLDMLVEGFSMQLDKLYEDENLDITSDVEVLKQMLAKDGLSRDDFSKFMDGYGGSQSQ